jgi:hypothetical protein
MLPVMMIVGGLLALWIQSQPQTTEQQSLPSGMLRAVGGMLVIGGVVAFFSQTIAFVLVAISLVLGFLTARRD